MDTVYSLEVWVPDGEQWRNSGKGRFEWEEVAKED